MTFLDRENSNYSGEPVLLYEFARGMATIFGYASSDRDVTANNGTVDIVYKATPISNSGQSQKGTAVTDVFEITCPTGLDIVQWYRYTPPSDTIYVAVRRFHIGDTQSVIVWLGQVVSVQENADETATIKCQQIAITLKRGGLRMTWQRGCIHALYDQNCRVDKTAYAVGVSVLHVNINSITLDATPDPSVFWNGGILEFDMPGLTGVRERRLIESIQGSTLTPYGQMDAYAVGLALTLYPGCKRTGEWCNSFFNNIENYGGFEFMPNRSPFDGDSVF